MWGLLLGAVGLGVVLIVVFFLSGSLGSGGAGCDRPLAPLGESEISTLEFQKADVGLAEAAAAGQRGDLAGAESNFFGPVHNFTHNVDPPLREQNPELAKRLCETVIKLEDEFSRGRRPLEIGILAQELRVILQDAARELGVPAPTG